MHAGLSQDIEQSGLAESPSCYLKGHAETACDLGGVSGCVDACPSQGSVAADEDGATLLVLHSRAAGRATALRLTPQPGADGAAPSSQARVEVRQALGENTPH